MINNVVIVGRMTRDAELRQTGSGVSVTSFTLAVDRERREQDGSRKADFIGCVAWRHNADYICKYGGKGRMVAVSGRLQFREWTDKDGNGRRNAEIQTESVCLCDSKKSEVETEPVQPSGFREISDEGDLPF